MMNYYRLNRTESGYGQCVCVCGGGGGVQCHQDLLIYWTQWSIDLDDLLIWDKCLKTAAKFILNDLVTYKRILLRNRHLCSCIIWVKCETMCRRGTRVWCLRGAAIDSGWLSVTHRQEKAHSIFDGDLLFIFNGGFPGEKNCFFNLLNSVLLFFF